MVKLKTGKPMSNQLTQYGPPSTEFWTNTANLFFFGVKNQPLVNRFQVQPMRNLYTQYKAPKLLSLGHIALTPPNLVCLVL